MKRTILSLLLLLVAGPAMSLGLLQGSVQDKFGNVLPGTTITVFGPDSSTTRLLFSDRDGTTAIANPISADTSGKFKAYVAGGYCVLYYSGSGVTPHYDVEYVVDGETAFDITEAAYGAIAGDGLDDSAAVQAAADAADAQGGGTIFFPPGGTFLIQNTVTLGSDVTLTGGGKIVSGVTGSGYSAGFVFRAVGESGIDVIGLEVNGASTATDENGTAYPGIFCFHNCTDVTVRDCHIYDSGADALLFSSNYPTTTDPCENVVVSGCLIEDSRRDGIAIISADGIVISDNNIIGTFGAAIDIEPETARAAGDVIIRGNRIHCERTNDFDLSTWPRSLDCTTSTGTINRIVIDSNYFSYVMPDDYLATAATSTNVVMQVFILGVTGPLQFSNNTIYTNQLSDGGTNYALLNFGGSGAGVTGGLSITGNTIIRAETTPAVADGEGHAAWKGVGIRGSDGVVATGNKIMGAFNEPLWVRDCDNMIMDVHIENTSNSILSNVTSGATFDTCNDVRLSGYISSPDNTIVLDTVDGLIVSGAYLKSANGGVHIRNQGAASDHVAAIGCMTDQNDGTAFPNCALDQNNDGNTIANFYEALTVDLTE